MALQPGTTLGPYSVTAKIGEGGMGEVYRARDTKLDRDVALKVLPQAFTDDPDRLARFEREAKVLASLNHTNIGHLYGLEEAEGQKALVLELVEGPTLADRIAQGPIPVDEALPIAKQIAEALEVAHEQGIIHRDLKPANIKVKDDGTVKVLDFGLAKAFQPDTSDASLSMSPTISLTAAATQMGMVIGTAAYMAPEQAKGKPVDRRADVWSFGAVLYEMLTGQKPFVGDDVSDTLALVLKFEPEWDALPADTPARLRQLVQTCLQKNPKQRIHDVADVRLAMEGAFETTLNASSTATEQAGWRQALPWVVGLLLAAITGIAVWTLTQPGQQPLTRFSLLPPEGVQLQGSVQLAPDGQSIAFVGVSEEGQSQVYVRDFDQLEAVPLRGTEGMGWVLEFSPDTQWLLVQDPAGSTLRRARLSGGPPERIASGLIRGGAWRPDDVIVHGSLEGLWLLPAGGGDRTSLTTRRQGELVHGVEEFLPNGRAVLFTISTGQADTAQVAVYDFEAGQRRTLLAGASASFARTGHLVFWRDGSLWAVPFDPGRLELRGDPVRVVDKVSTSLIGGAANYTLADDGTLVYLSGGSPTDRTFGWVNRQGVMTTPLVEGRDQPRLSASGSLMAFRKQDMDLWIWDLENERETRLTEAGAGQYPLWTVDDTSVMFTSDRGASFDLYERPADISRQTESILVTEGTSVPGSWTPDGQTLIYYAVNSQGDRDIWMKPVGGDPVPFLATGFHEKAPRLSPNGKWLAYISDQFGEDRVFVRAFPEGGGTIPISTGPGTEAVWSRDGRELFYRNGNQMWAVAVETGSNFSAGRPELLFEAPYVLDPLGNATYDVSLNGEHFLMVQQTGLSDESPGFTIIQNWTEELTRLVPVP
jgi:hypothetical protein